MSNFIQVFEEEDIEQFNGDHDTGCINPTVIASKKKRNLPGNPDPEAEVVALSPRTLMATNRYICEVCHKGFQRDQNLQLHRRGHNLPWKLKQRNPQQVKEVKKRVYVCPETNCVHHDPSRALGDLTGIKKHFCRKHGEKKWKCDKCSKRYAVQSDWKAHSKICGTREYRCDCGTIFSRKDSFVTHRAFCDALTEENYKMNRNPLTATGGGVSMLHCQGQANQELFSDSGLINLSVNSHQYPHGGMTTSSSSCLSTNFFNPRSLTTRPPSCLSSSVVNDVASSAYTSATALLQKASEMGSKISDDNSTIAPILLRGFTGYSSNNNNLSTTTTVQEVSSSCKMSATTNNNISSSILLYAGGGAGQNQQTFDFDKNVEEAVGDHQRVGYPRHDQEYGGGLYDDSPLLMHSSSNTNSTAQVLMGMGGRAGGGKKMTVDFLGVEPAATHSNFGKKRSYDGNNIMGVRPYSSTQAQQHHNNNNNNLYNNLHSEW